MDFTTVDFGAVNDGIVDMLTDSNIIVVALAVLALYEGFRFAKWLYKTVRK